MRRLALTLILLPSLALAGSGYTPPETDPVATVLISDGSGVTDAPGWWEALAPAGLLPSLDGRNITNLSTAGESGKPFYLIATASDISGYKVAATAPGTAAESTLTQANTGTDWTLVDEFATPSGSPGVTVLPAGIAGRSIWAHVDHAAAVGNIKVEIYKRTAGGVETLLRDGASGAFSGVVPVMVTWSLVDGLSYALDLTDRLVFKLYTARISGPASVLVTIYLEGVEHASYVRSTIAESNPALTSLALVGQPTAADQILKSTAAGVWSLAAESGACADPSDWADACYGSAAVVLADWPDADDAGGVDGICRDQVTSGRIRLRAALDSDCSTDYGTGTRTGGVLRSIGAGDFRAAFRWSWSPKSWANFNGTHLAGVAFLDGTDAAADSWYGVAMYASAGTTVLYDFQNATGANRWEGYQAAAFTSITTAWPSVDVVMERVGTTLTHYCAPARGAFVPCGTETVSAGAGMIGLRVQVETSTADEYDISLDAYRTGLSEIP